jgi:hypothetical protein
MWCVVLIIGRADAQMNANNQTLYKYSITYSMLLCKLFYVCSCFIYKADLMIFQGAHESPLP